MSIRVAINGFGRIGRQLARVLVEDGTVQLSHINDPAYEPALAAHLLQHDSEHGFWPLALKAHADTLQIQDHIIGFSREYDLKDVAWGRHADIVVDCSGRFSRRLDLLPYLEAGAKAALLSAPIQGAPNIVPGVNDDTFNVHETPIASCASCTTNAVAVLADVIHQQFGIQLGFITTLHALTNDQALLDQAHGDWRRARAAHASLIPTSSGFAKTIGRVIPSLDGRLEGLAVRAPVSNASLIDAVFTLETATDATLVNACFAAAAAGHLQGRLGIEWQPLVSADYRGDRRSAVVDAELTRVLQGRLLKVLAWYDNETAYVQRLAELVEHAAQQLH